MGRSPACLPEHLESGAIPKNYSREAAAVGEKREPSLLMFYPLVQAGGSVRTGSPRNSGWGWEGRLEAKEEAPQRVKERASPSKLKEAQ